VAGHLGNLEGSQWGYLNLTGSGTLIMTDGTGSQNTPTIGPNATMQIGNGGTTGDLPNAAGAGGVTNNGTLSFNRSNAYTPIRAISGTGQVVQNGTGTVTLSQASTYTGATVVNNGILKAGIASVANVSGAFGNNSAVTPGEYFRRGPGHHRVQHADRLARRRRGGGRECEPGRGGVDRGDLEHLHLSSLLRKSREPRCERFSRRSRRTTVA
jgi:autotransporter-associated beta strand protein